MDVRDAITAYLGGDIGLEEVKKAKQGWKSNDEEPNLSSPVIEMYMKEHDVTAKEALKIRMKEVDKINRQMMHYYKTDYYAEQVNCFYRSTEFKLRYLRDALRKAKTSEEKQKFAYDFADNLVLCLGHFKDELKEKERWCDLVELGLGCIM